MDNDSIEIPVKPPGPAGEGFVPKRGRPTRAQVAAIEKSILTEAMRMFLNLGYASTSMEMVAANAGVSKGTLYARYPAKADLFKAIVADRISTWAAEKPALNMSDVGLPEYLMAVGTSFLRQLATPEVTAFDRLVRSEATRFPELALELHQQGYLILIDGLSQAIEQGGTRSGWPVVDSRGVAEVFASAILGWHREESNVGPIDDMRSVTFVARVVALVIGGRSSW